MRGRHVGMTYSGSATGGPQPPRPGGKFTGSGADMPMRPCDFHPCLP